MSGLHSILAFLALAPSAPTRTIATGVFGVRPKETYIKVGTEADASTDQLDAITGGTDGQFLLLTPDEAGKAVVIVNNSTAEGQIWTQGGRSITLTSANDYALLFCSGGEWNVVASSTQTDVVSAIVAENTDVIVPMDVLGQFFAVSGTWTPARPATAQYRLRRTAAAAAHDLALKAFPRSRTSTSKGIKVTGFKMAYTVGTADINDVTVAAAYQVLPATGSAPAAAVSFGAITYDAAHDTAPERKAVGSHTMTVTFGTPVYLPAGVDCVEVLLNVDGTASGVFDLLGAELLCSETLVDAA